MTEERANYAVPGEVEPYTWLDLIDDALAVLSAWTLGDGGCDSVTCAAQDLVQCVLSGGAALEELRKAVPRELMGADDGLPGSTG